MGKTRGLRQRLPAATTDKLAGASFPVGRLVIVDWVALDGRLMLHARLRRVQVQTTSRNRIVSVYRTERQTDTVQCFMWLIASKQGSGNYNALPTRGETRPGVHYNSL